KSTLKVLRSLTTTLSIPRTASSKSTSSVSNPNSSFSGNGTPLQEIAEGGCPLPIEVVIQIYSFFRHPRDHTCLATLRRSLVASRMLFTVAYVILWEDPEAWVAGALSSLPARPTKSFSMTDESAEHRLLFAMDYSQRMLRLRRTQRMMAESLADLLTTIELPLRPEDAEEAAAAMGRVASEDDGSVDLHTEEKLRRLGYLFSIRHLKLLTNNYPEVLPDVLPFCEKLDSVHVFPDGMRGSRDKLWDFIENMSGCAETGRGPTKLILEETGERWTPYFIGLKGLKELTIIRSYRGDEEKLSEQVGGWISGDGLGSVSGPGVSSVPPWLTMLRLSGRFVDDNIIASIARSPFLVTTLKHLTLESFPAGNLTPLSTLMSLTSLQIIHWSPNNHPYGSHLNLNQLILSDPDPATGYHTLTDIFPTLARTLRTLKLSFRAPRWAGHAILDALANEFESSGLRKLHLGFEGAQVDPATLVSRLSRLQALRELELHLFNDEEKPEIFVGPYVMGALEGLPSLEAVSMFGITPSWPLLHFLITPPRASLLRQLVLYRVDVGRAKGGGVDEASFMAVAEAVVQRRVTPALRVFGFSVAAGSGGDAMKGVRRQVKETAFGFTFDLEASRPDVHAKIWT
ncbi:hypothetical protein HK101_001413, partial [Irineochytrium annulatum]